MKKIAPLLAAMMVAVIVYPQTIKEEIDLFQSVFGMEKKHL